MRIVCAAQSPNKIIANGNLRKDTIIWSNELNCQLNQSEWFVSYPINNYDVSINIGDYVHFSDFYISEDDSLDLSYYVLSYNEEKARKHFQQVKPMMDCFQKYFGRYLWEVLRTIPPLPDPTHPEEGERIGQNEKTPTRNAKRARANHP